MEIIKCDSYEQLSRKAASILAAEITLKPNCVLGLATGSSPVGIYKQLIEWYKQGDLDFSQVSSINLDEYVGLTEDHPQGYRYFMQDNLFDHVNIQRENTFVPNGIAKNLKKECRDYDARVKKMGIDVQVLGIGFDGHIGFNEPGNCFVAGTHVVTLEESTIKANSRFFKSEDEVPKKAVTMGMEGIMQAKKIVLVANGKGKIDILFKALEGPITPKVPASILQLHPNVVVLYSEN